MASLVVEAFLSAGVQTLLDRIASSDFQDFFRNKKLNVELLNKLKMTLFALSAVLNDAEEKQITNPAVREWLDELKDAVLDAEDLLDEINTDALKCKVESEPQNVAYQVRKLFISSPFNQFYRQINSKMEEMCRRLDSFEKQKDILGLQSVTGRIPRRTPTTSLLNESVMVGRKEDEEKLINLLLSDVDLNGGKIGVLTILGMGGVGKTTLAQLLYNNKQVQEHFDLKAWACVSEDYDVFLVTKTLLESITSNKTSNSSKNLDYLRVELNHNLRDKKFLFVLDDLWNDEYNDWDDLITPFTSGQRGSKIVVTTRQQRVADVTHTFPIHKCEPLSEDDCWSLLAKHAFGNEDFSKYPNLEATGRRIAKKCGGLPIAAKTLGGLLRSKVDAKEWNKVLESNIWDLPSNKVLPALRLSYLYLPAHLKRCFAYCSIFPNDYWLGKKQLVLLWMAEGLIPESKDEKTMEELGEDYFDELLSRSLIQQYKYFDGMFVMHDLVNDLARVVSGKTCFRLAEGHEVQKNVRHFSYQREEYNGFKKFEALCGLISLRSFLSSGWGEYLSPKVPNNLLPMLKRLRVLSLCHYDNIVELPDSIGNLVHLRYLDLSCTKIKRLPDATCKLYNLQTLKLSSCESLTELPAQIGKLLNLRHLDISGTKLKEIPMQIKGLTNLQTLSTFIVGRQKDGLRVRELRNFPHLRGRLEILELQNVENVMDAYEVDLKNKEEIEELELKWGIETLDSRNERDVLEQLQPCTNLRRLTIGFYGGTSFPSWLGDFSYSNIVSLRIDRCNHCLSLPPLGQLRSLKDLMLVGLNLVKSVGAEFYDSGGCCSFQPFPSLERLSFYNMLGWEEWLTFDGEGIEFPFPCLRDLSLCNCPTLRGYLPPRLPSSLIEVMILKCDLLEASTVSWMTSIKSLHIVKGGPSLLSMVEAEDVSQCSLRNVYLEEWESLQSLPTLILASNRILSLHLKNISSLTCFPTLGLPSLNELYISDCPNLEFPLYETWRSYTSLEWLNIQNSCHSMTSIPLDCFPTALKHLSIFRSPNLKSLSISEEASPHTQSLLRLESLEISKSPNFESFPNGGLPAPNLKTLQVLDCEKLGPLSISQAGFQRLTSLSKLYVGGDDLVDALLKHQLLPTSLVQLNIRDLADLKFMEGNGLQHLTSLKVLRIEYCLVLESLPQHGLPSSLEELRINNCPMLECLPEDWLPSSLSSLRINACPRLEARYQSQKERHWHKIAHIPVIVINGELLT